MNSRTAGLQAALDMARVWAGVSLAVADNVRHDRWERMEARVRYEGMVAYCRALEALLREDQQDCVVELRLGEDTPTAVE